MQKIDEAPAVLQPQGASDRKDITMRKLLSLLIIAIIVGTAQGASAGPLEDGYAAYKRGDFATALSVWRPLAAQGNPWAQANLGTMYSYGNGVAQDHKEAVRWHRLASLLCPAYDTTARNPL